MVTKTIEEKCPVEAVAGIIGRKWVSLILRDLQNGPKRFGELGHSIPVSARILSLRLQELETEGLITRQVFAEVPPRTEYTLTARGQLLIPVIETMRKVGKDFI
jgi:DNA-binding HxlR family transcriptional regulator